MLLSKCAEFLGLAAGATGKYEFGFKAGGAVTDLQWLATDAAGAVQDAIAVRLVGRFPQTFEGKWFDLRAASTQFGRRFPLGAGGIAVGDGTKFTLEVLNKHTAALDVAVYLVGTEAD